MKYLFRRLYRLFKDCFRFLKWTPYIYFNVILEKFRHDRIFVESYVKYKGFGITTNNWGDDINKYFLEIFSHKKVIFLPHMIFYSYARYLKHYMFIGSVIGNWRLDNTIIFGSGVRLPDVKLIGKPMKIIAVRGPLTASVLTKNGINCPDVFGDPALLLPKYYKPIIKSDEKRPLIVIHYESKLSTNIRELASELNANILNMGNYKKWTDVIDVICNASYVISESLHGLIVSEAYKIPSVWIEFIEHPDYWNFKFNDFYESIGKKSKAPIIVYNNSISLQNIEYEVNTWKCIDLSFDYLDQLNPFEIKEES